MVETEHFGLDLMSRFMLHSGKNGLIAGNDCWIFGLLKMWLEKSLILSLSYCVIFDKSFPFSFLHFQYVKDDNGYQIS